MVSWVMLSWVEKDGLFVGKAVFESLEGPIAPEDVTIQYKNWLRE